MNFQVADIPYQFNIIHRPSQQSKFVRRESVAQKLKLDAPKQDKFADLLTFQDTKNLTLPRDVTQCAHNLTANMQVQNTSNIVLPQKFSSMSGPDDSLMLTVDLKSTYHKQRTIVDQLNQKINHEDKSEQTLSNTDELIYINNDSEMDTKFGVKLNQPDVQIASRLCDESVLQLCNPKNMTIRPVEVSKVAQPKALKQQSQKDQKRFTCTQTYDIGQFQGIENPSDCKQSSVFDYSMNEVTQYGTVQQERKLVQKSRQQDIIRQQDAIDNYQMKTQTNEICRQSFQQTSKNQSKFFVTNTPDLKQRLCDETFNTLNQPRNENKQLTAHRQLSCLETYEIASPRQQHINKKIQEIEQKIQLSKYQNKNYSLESIHQIKEQPRRSSDNQIRRITTLQQSIINDIQQEKQQKQHYQPARLQFKHPNEIKLSRVLIEEKPVVQLKQKSRFSNLNQPMTDSMNTEYLEGSVAQLMASQHGEDFEFK